MNTRQSRLALWGVSTVLGTATVVLLLAGWLWPYDLPQITTGMSADTSAGRSSSDPAALPALSTFEPIWRLNLQRPLYDAPPSAVAKQSATPKPRSLNIKLAGTVVEPGKSMALFTTSTGKMELKGIGDDIDGARLLDIVLDRVSVQYRGKTIDLVLEKKRQAP